MKTYPGKRLIQLGLLWVILFVIKEAANFFLRYGDFVKDFTSGVIPWQTEVLALATSITLVISPGIIFLLIGLRRAWKADVYSQNQKKLLTVKIIWCLLWVPLLLLF